MCVLSPYNERRYVFGFVEGWSNIAAAKLSPTVQIASSTHRGSIMLQW